MIHVLPNFRMNMRTMRVGYCRVGEEGGVVWLHAGCCGLRTKPTHWTELPEPPGAGEKS